MFQSWKRKANLYIWYYLRASNFACAQPCENKNSSFGSHAPLGPYHRISQVSSTAATCHSLHFKRAHLSHLFKLRNSILLFKGQRLQNLFVNFSKSVNQEKVKLILIQKLHYVQCFLSRKKFKTINSFQSYNFPKPFSLWNRFRI